MDERLIEEVRLIAQSQDKTLEQLFQEMLAEYAGRERVRKYREVMDRIGKFETGGPFTRDQMNER